MFFMFPSGYGGGFWGSLSNVMVGNFPNYLDTSSRNNSTVLWHLWVSCLCQYGFSCLCCKTKLFSNNFP